MNDNGFRQMGDKAERDYGVEESEISVSHVHGDAANRKQLEDVIMKTYVDGQKCKFDTVIVMGTTYEGHLEAHSTDTRVLTILLLLRSIKESHPQLEHMHVISENAEDATSMLALPPSMKEAEESLSHRCSSADFVNSQAIGARVLAQCLAYPVMSS